MITKTVGERTKRRLIMDCLMSGANGKTLQQERILLPRIADLIYDVLALLDKCEPGEQIFSLVLDFVDAFFRVPPLP